MTREHREAEIRDYVGYLDRVRNAVLEEARAPGARVTVLGFSQGVHTAARWAVLGERPPERLVLWGEYLPPDLDMELAARRLDGVDLVLVMGERDLARREDLARDQVERLETWGVAHRAATHAGVLLVTFQEARHVGYEVLCRGIREGTWTGTWTATRQGPWDGT